MKKSKRTKKSKRLTKITIVVDANAVDDLMAHVTHIVRESFSAAPHVITDIMHSFATPQLANIRDHAESILNEREARVS